MEYEYEYEDFEQDLRGLRVQFARAIAGLLCKVPSLQETDDDLNGCRACWAALETHIDAVHTRIVAAMTAREANVTAYNYVLCGEYVDRMSHYAANLTCAAHDAAKTPGQREMARDAVACVNEMVALARELLQWGANMQNVYNDGFVDISDEDTQEYTATDWFWLEWAS